MRNVAATLYARDKLQRPLADVFAPEGVPLFAAAPVLLGACEQALQLIRDHWPVEHGSKKVGQAWGALVAAIEAARPPHATGDRVTYRPAGTPDAPEQSGIVQRAYHDRDTGDSDYTVFLTAANHSVFAHPSELRPAPPLHVQPT